MLAPKKTDSKRSILAIASVVVMFIVSGGLLWWHFFRPADTGGLPVVPAMTDAELYMMEEGELPEPVDTAPVSVEAFSENELEFTEWPAFKELRLLPIAIEVPAERTADPFAEPE